MLECSQTCPLGSLGQAVCYGSLPVSLSREASPHQPAGLHPLWPHLQVCVDLGVGVDSFSHKAQSSPRSWVQLLPGPEAKLHEWPPFTHSVH